MNTIPIKLSSNDIEKIDELIRRCIYENRGQTIREFISKALDRSKILYAGCFFCIFSRIEETHANLLIFRFLSTER